MIAGKLKELRKQRNLTQHELSRLSGVSNVYISELEKNETKKPSLDIMQKLASALKVSLLDLVYSNSEGIHNFRERVAAERDRQRKIWGEQYHHDAVWNTILVKEVGEVAQAILKNEPENMLFELVQVVAVVETWVESLERIEKGI